MTNNRAAINKLLNITQRLETREYEIIKAQKLLEINSMVNHRISTLKFALDELALMLTTFQTRLSDIFIGHLTPNVIDPATLYSTLRDIQGQLPNGFSMPFDLEQNLYKYYQQLSCYLERVDGNFTIIIGLPLSDETSRYSLLRVHTYEIPFENSSVVASYDISSEYIIVSPDYSEIMYPDSDDIAGCTASGYHICTIHKPIYYTNKLLDTCLVALLLDQPNQQQVCPMKTKVRDHGGTIANYEGDGIWIVSIHQETIFQVVCERGQYQLKLQPNFAQVKLTDGCYAHCNDLTLPPYFSKSSHFRDIHHMVGYPELPPIWDKIEKDLAISQQLAPQQMDQILDLQPDLNHLHEQIQQELSKFDSSNDWLQSMKDSKLDSWPVVMLTLISVLAVLLVALIIYWWCTRQMKNGQGKCIKLIMRISGRQTNDDIEARTSELRGRQIRSCKRRRTLGPEKSRSRASTSFHEVSTDTGFETSEISTDPPKIRKDKRATIAEQPMEIDGLTFEAGVGQI